MYPLLVEMRGNIQTRPVLHVRRSSILRSLCTQIDIVLCALARVAFLNLFFLTKTAPSE